MSDTLRQMDLTTAESLLELAEDLSPNLTSPHADDALERLDARADEVDAAIGWFLGADRMDEALRLANAMYRFWILKRRFADGDRAFARVLQPGTGDDRHRARAHLYAGFMPFWMGDDFSDDAVFLSPRGPGPWGRRFQGKAAVREGPMASASRSAAATYGPFAMAASPRRTPSGRSSNPQWTDD